MPEKIEARSEYYTVHQGCFARPYVQLEVPSTTIRVRSLELSIKSRDQGWGGGGIPCTWHDVHIQRSPEYPGRNHANPITFYRNPTAVEKFGHHTCRWDCDDPASSPFNTAWVASILPGDTIQIVPKAFGQGWTNIVSEASIKIEYDEKGDGAARAGRQPESLYHGYNKLDSRNGQIRVLVVDSGEFSDSIVARFETVHLLNGRADESQKTSSAPEFLALSYCWGELSEQTELNIALCDSGNEFTTVRRFPVSQNVVAAIRRLRTPNQPLRIWIDAVCINQQDMDERSEQVAIMGSIYRSAAQVHIWLGEEGQALKSTLRIIRDACNITEPQPDVICAGGDQCSCGQGRQHMINRETFLAERARDKEKDTNKNLDYMDIIFQKHRAHFADERFYAPDIDAEIGLSILMSELFGHPWFWRVWVIQEAILAKNAIVHCGEEMVRWKDLMKFHQRLDSPQYRLEFYKSHYQPQVQMPPIWATLDRINLDGTLQSDPAAHGPNSPESILDIFLNTLDLSATNPRDKLYALLPFGKETFSMRTEIPVELQPNYKTPCDEVYASFTRWVMRQENSLAALSLVHCHPARTWNRMLCDMDAGAVNGGPAVPRPTWSISPQGQTRFIYSNLNRQFSFRAGGTTVPDRRLLDDESDPLALKVTGYEIGSIVVKGYPPFIKGRDGSGVDIFPVQRDCNFREPENLSFCVTGVGVPLFVFQDAQPLSTVDNTQPGLERVADAMFDPCRGDRFQRGLLSSWAEPINIDSNSWIHTYADHLKSHFAYFPDPKSLPVLVREILHNHRLELMMGETEFIPPCLSECYFISSNGHVGLCPWPAKEGDIIALLHGATVPYLLRPAAREVQATGEDDKEYELVGECFVEGVMDGELMEKMEKDGNPPQKSNRHPSEIEPPAKPKSGRSLRRRLAYFRDDSVRVEDEEGDDSCQPPDGIFTRTTLLPAYNEFQRQL
ncbi:heterokaryon incompatibility protein-domain-containing protein [Xylaria sp. FL1777]|nr:heterokaryon incompatibility protein-domain-containing protein [Xylaria sp. FL1777]